jgi:hypothetical protein
MKVNEVYYARVAEALPRLLGLLDRNPLSPTYGCFDRSYWLHRKTDFPSSTAQLSLKTLALCYRNQFPGNFLFGSPQALAWAKAAIDFTLKIQHRDGSFDEWYPNERGWAGPTGYVAHALFEARRVLAADLPESLLKRLDKCLLRAAHHLARRDEGDVLANHHAIALLPLAEIAELLESPKLKHSATEWLENFRSHTNNEGWSLEYDGCDIGYNLGTLDFLADLHRLRPTAFLLDYARSSLKFLSHFAFPDGSWAGALGSRHTSHSYPYALEYWARLLPEARALLKHSRLSLADGVAVAPKDQEDHYLHYRLADYLKAALIAEESDLGAELLPYEKPDFERAYFSKAGFLVERKGNHMIWVALKRGGAFRLYDLRQRRAVCVNNGCLVGSGDEVFTSLWQSGGGKPGEAIEIKSKLHQVFVKRFSPGTFLLFRAACLGMKFPLLAFWFKRWVRARMITPRNGTQSDWWRKIQWDDSGIRVKDHLVWRELRAWQRIFWGGEFSSRYVPQSHYFQSVDLDHPPGEFLPVRGQLSPLEFEWKYDFLEGKSSFSARGAVKAPPQV